MATPFGQEAAKYRDVDCFTLPFIPSHQGRENPVPSPLMGEGDSDYSKRTAIKAVPTVNRHRGLVLKARPEGINPRLREQKNTFVGQGFPKPLTGVSFGVRVPRNNKDEFWAKHSPK